MILTAKYLIELPYILNLEDGDYDFSYKDVVITININNNLYALASVVNSLQLTSAIGTREQLLPHSTNLLPLIKTRTIVSFNRSYYVHELDQIERQDLINSLRSRLFEGNKYPSDEDAQIRLNSLTESQLDDLEKSVRLEKTFHKFFPPKLAEPYIDLVNCFIRQYSVHFKDHFAEEVSLYQAASGLTNGIMIQFYCDHHMITAIPVVGSLIPPLLRNTLYTHKENETETFKKVIMSGEPEDSSSLLLIRAKNLLTKGAYRSATLEASASIENHIRIKLIEAMSLKGSSEKDIETELSINHSFDSRCRKLFKKYYSKSVPEISPKEWQMVKHDRDSVRHKTTHTSHEPNKTDVEEMINHIENLIPKIDEYIKKHIP
ncbi:hypothetical protein C7420_11820 [Pantoea ananatis]|uniref:hypothetical protein n=1 Tax=Pantoea ananas TaxID=553 RepID=UPI000DC200CC|nr:hypothetical protein [Pantoea ananatis]RAR65411.1 hypothetical protein C7420_11820 [Pantoea ananatis]